MLRWGLPCLAAAVQVGFWPGWLDGGLATRWGVLAIGAPFLLLFTRVHMTPAHWVGLAFVLWSALTMLWTPVPVLGLGDLAKTIILAFCFLLGAEAADMRRTYLAVILGVSISGYLALAQAFGFELVPQAAPPAGLFINRNFLAEIGVVSFALAVGVGRWWMIPGTLLASLLPASRGSLVSIACIAIVLAWRRSYR